MTPPAQVDNICILTSPAPNTYTAQKAAGSIYRLLYWVEIMCPAFNKRIEACQHRWKMEYYRCSRTVMSFPLDQLWYFLLFSANYIRWRAIVDRAILETTAVFDEPSTYHRIILENDRDKPRRHTNYRIRNLGHRCPIHKRSGHNSTTGHHTSRKLYIARNP